MNEQYEDRVIAGYLKAYWSQGARQHRQRTAACPTIPELVKGVSEDKRAHTESCPYCRKVLARVAAGRCRPAVSRLQEMLRGAGAELLRLRLGYVPADFASLADRVSQKLDYELYGGAEPVFSGFGVSEGESVRVEILAPDGETVNTVDALVAEAECDPMIRTAYVTLGLPDLSEGISVLVAQAEAKGVFRYSLAGEVQGGRATLSAEGLPTVIGDLRVEHWYAIQNPSTPEGPQDGSVGTRGAAISSIGRAGSSSS